MKGYQAMKETILSVLSERGQTKLEDLQSACCESPREVGFFNGVLFNCQQAYLVEKDTLPYDREHPEDFEKEVFRLIDQSTREPRSFRDESRLRKLRKGAANVEN
jgi:hypothetical protein